MINVCVILKQIVKIGIIVPNLILMNSFIAHILVKVIYNNMKKSVKSVEFLMITYSYFMSYLKMLNPFLMTCNGIESLI